MLHDDGDGVHLGVEDGLQGLVRDLVQRALGNVLVLAKDGFGVVDIGCGEDQWHLNSLALRLLSDRDRARSRSVRKIAFILEVLCPFTFLDSARGLRGGVWNLQQAEIGIIGGSGLYAMPGLTEVREERVGTPFGDPSDAFVLGKLEGRKVAF